MLLQHRVVGNPPAFRACPGSMHSHSSRGPCHKNKLASLFSSTSNRLWFPDVVPFTHVLPLVLDTPSRGADGARAAQLLDAKWERGTRLLSNHSRDSAEAVINTKWPVSPQ